MKFGKVSFHKLYEMTTNIRYSFYVTGLTNKRIGRLEDALDCFYKLHAILRNSPQVIYQIADVYPLFLHK